MLLFVASVDVNPRRCMLAARAANDVIIRIEAIGIPIKALVLYGFESTKNLERVVSGFAIISMFPFKKNSNRFGIGLIVLSVVTLYAIGNFRLLRLRHPEIALFVVGAITALGYKN